MRGALAFTALLLALSLQGCAAAMDLGRATTLDPGDVRWSGGLEASVLRAGVRKEQESPIPWVQMETGVHLGVTDKIEVGGRAWGFGWPGLVTTFGVAADSKFQLHRGRFRGDPHLATGLTLTWYSPALGNQPWTLLGATVPLLVGFDIGKSQLVFGPRATGWYVGSYGQTPLWTGEAGAGVGWSIRLGRAELFPELLWMVSPINFDGARHTADRTGAEGFHAALGFAWHPSGD
ncbi:MAG: hypothetical protein Q8P18_21195 [Pseudomonadota bacterium]|nr:hypothetical protein [Pseudomonadota bacterium]